MAKDNPNTPERFEPTACAQEPTAEMPMSKLSQIRIALILAKVNAVELFGQTDVSCPSRGQRAVLEMYQKDIDILSGLVQWMERAYPHKDQGPTI